MRTVAYKTVLDRAAGLLQGLAGAAADGVLGLDRTDGAVAQSFIQRAVQEFWERYQWPELCVVERRLFRTKWTEGATYAAGDEVFFWPTLKYYQALKTVSPSDSAPADGNAADGYVTNGDFWAEVSTSVATDADDWDETVAYAVGDRVRSPADGNIYQAHTTSTGVEPPDVTKWGLRTDFEWSVSLDQAGQTPIGLVRRLWDVNPRTCDPDQLAGHEVKFDVFNDDVIVRPGCGGLRWVWVQFWTRPPNYSGAAYADSIAYNVGTQVYFTDGDFYRCVTNTTAGQSPDPDSAPTKWERLEFPRILAEMVAWRVFGEMDPKHGDGPMGDGLTMAEDYFAREIEKIERQQGQARQINVLTR